MTAAIGVSRRKEQLLQGQLPPAEGTARYLRAAIAIAQKIPVVAYDLLAPWAPFRDLGEAYLDQQARRRSTADLIRRLSTLG